MAGSTLGGQEQTIAIACYTAGVYLGGNGSHNSWAGGGGVGTHNTRVLTGREWGDGGGKEGELFSQQGHQLDGFDCVLIVVAAQPVGGVVFLREVLEDFHEGAWEDASGSLGCTLWGKRSCLNWKRNPGPHTL